MLLMPFSATLVHHVQPDSVPSKAVYLCRYEMGLFCGITNECAHPSHNMLLLSSRYYGHLQIHVNIPSSNNSKASAITGSRVDQGNMVTNITSLPPHPSSPAPLHPRHGSTSTVLGQQPDMEGWICMSVCPGYGFVQSPQEKPFVTHLQ